MTETSEITGAVRFPFIPLARAIERARELNKQAAQHPVLASDAQKMWGYTEKASGGFQTIAALKYYELISDDGTKDRRQLKLTPDARRYFLDEREDVQEGLIRKFALSPQAFLNLWLKWKDEPPSDAVARSTLKVDFGYAEKAAAELLTIYKTNLAFAKLTDAADDSQVTEQAPPPRFMRRAPIPSPASVDAADGEHKVTGLSPHDPPVRTPPPPPRDKGLALMADERELTTGLLAKDASFRLIVTGKVGVKEIERLIRKLELDKEILADESGDEAGGE